MEEKVGQFSKSLMICQILPSKLANDVHNRESKQAVIHHSFTRQKLLMENSPVFLHQTFALYSNFSFTGG